MTNQQLQLVTFEQAKALKALGFDWVCGDFYWSHGKLSEFGCLANRNKDNYGFSAPTVALALKWFRDVEKKTIGIALSNGRYVGEDGAFCGLCNYSEYHDTYEAAESALLDALLKTMCAKHKGETP